MKRIALALILCIAACGDDDTKNSDNPGHQTPEVVTGRFVDSPVAHLHYATPTRSGETDADGTFEYMTGETVTFSIGGTTLGAVEGAATITPLSLFGVTGAPVSFAELYRLADYTRRSVTGYDRALNVALFLQSLDADGNPTNGIDLTGKAELLANVALSFDTTALHFADQFVDLALTYGFANARLPREAVAQNLYSGAGLSAAGQQIVRISYDSDNDGTPNAVYDITYDAQGRVTSLGTTDTLTLYEYDAASRIVVERYRSSPDGAGDFNVEFSMTRTYDAAGALTREDRLTQSNFAVPESSSTAYTYDERHRLAQEVRNNDTTVTLTYSYDANNVVSIAASGSADVSTRAYDMHGNVTRRTSGDTSYVSTYVYDEAGRMTSAVEIESRISTAEILDRESDTVTYDGAGNATSIIESYGDGPSASTTTRETTYDDAGRPLVRTTRYTTGSDRDVETFTYEGARLTRRELRQLTATDELVRHTLYTYTYDANGNLTRELRENDDNGDETVDSRSSLTYEVNETPASVSGILCLVNYLNSRA